MNPPEKEQVEVPEKAYAAAFDELLIGVPGLTSNGRRNEEAKLRTAIQLAAPVLCAQERERLEADLKKAEELAQQRLDSQHRAEERREHALQEVRVQELANTENQRDAAAKRAMEMERLGLDRCPDCDEGVACSTDTERDPNGDLIPVPVQERCESCDGIGWINQAAQQERERVKEALLSDEAVDLVTARRYDGRKRGTVYEGVRAAVRADLEAALTTLDKETD